MQIAVIVSLAVLMVTSTAAAVYSLWWLATHRRRGWPAADREQLQRWARDIGIEPRRFETSRHLRGRLTAAMRDRRGISGRTERVLGLPRGLDRKRAVRA